MEPQDTNITLVAATALILIILSVMLNSLGLYLLSQIKEQRTYQNTILKNLSFAEIFMSIVGAIYFIKSITGKRDGMERFVWSIERAGSGVYLTYYLIMISIALDRLAMSILTIKYQTIITHRKIVIILACCWITCPCFSLMFYFLRSTEHEIMYPILDFSFIAFTISTYTYILHKLIKRKNIFHRDQAEISRQLNRRENAKRYNDLSRFYLMSGLIILTFIVLVAATNILRNYVFASNQQAHVVLHAVRMLNYVFDPCIYIFFQKPVRNLLKRRLNDLHVKRNRSNDGNQRQNQNDTTEV